MYQQNQVNTTTFGEAVKEARENKGWSREKLAEMLDISVRHVMYIETRGQRPSLQRLYELATLFSISIDEHLLPDTSKGKDTRRRQLDAMLDSMDEKDLSIVSATARAIQKVKETVAVGILYEESFVASTASEYPLADFRIFRSLPENIKNACWDNPKPL